MCKQLVYDIILLTTIREGWTDAMRRSVAGMALIVIGVIIIGSALYMKLSAAKEQKAMIQAFEKTIQDIDKGFVQAASDGESSNKEDYKEVKMGTVGIITIPKIDLKVAIGEGIDERTLKYAVGHFEGTALPGEKGNFCVAGHRSYTYSQYFNRLDELQPGDEILVKTQKGEFKYLVSEKLVVEPTEVAVLDKTKDASITLVTCTPIRVATHRLIIKGKLVE
jgi:sortase A